jgi:hypothetical protein
MAVLVAMKGVEVRLVSSKVWSQRRPTLIAILRPFQVLGLAPLTCNHLLVVRT